MSAPKRRRAGRDERGEGSLVELIIATVLAMMLLVMVAALAYQSERTVTVDRTAFAAQSSAIRSIGTAVAHLSAGAPLGVCLSPSAGTPLPSCAQPSSTGPIITAASGSGATQGFCYYAYPSGGDGLVAPSLECVVAYLGTTGAGTGAGNIYAISYQPTSGATYTSCEPGACFGAEAPAPGALPIEPTPSSCQTAEGCQAILGGTLSGAGTGAVAFSFESISGHALTSLSSAVDRAEIAKVGLSVTVASGAFGSKSTYTYHYTGAVSGAAYKQEASWASIA